MEKEEATSQAADVEDIEPEEQSEGQDEDRDVAPKRQRRGQAAAGQADYAGGSGAEAAEAAAGALAEAAAGSVLEAFSEESAVARLRGLPWSFSALQVCEFLEGVGPKVQPEAVTMLHNAAGEAFIALEAPAQLDEIKQANRTQVGKRYIEVFASSAAEKQAACERNRATMKEDAAFRGVLRLRGLPYSATADEVLQFFGSPVELQSSNVHLLKRSDGRPSGDAYVVFDTEDAATQGLQYDKQKLGSRWIDIFQSSKGELYSLTSVGGIMLPTAPGDEAAQQPEGAAALGDGYSVVKLRGLPWNVTIEDIETFLSPLAVPAGGVHLMNGANGRPSGLAYVELSTEEDQAAALAMDKQSIGGRYIDIFNCSQTELQARLQGGMERWGQGGAGGAPAGDAQFVKLRGLPYSATEQQVAGFFAPLQVVAVQIAFNAGGQPSGFGFVQLRTSEDVAAALQRSNQVLGSRYVEVFRCSRSDMEQAHMHAMKVAPMMRPPMYPPMGHQGPSMPMGPDGGHNPRGENAYSAYQAAMQTLHAGRHGPPYPPPASSYPQSACYGHADGHYPNGSGMPHGSYGGAEVGGGYPGGGYSAAASSGSGYGQGGGGYVAAPGGAASGGAAPPAGYAAANGQPGYGHGAGYGADYYSNYYHSGGGYYAQ